MKCNHPDFDDFMDEVRETADMLGTLLEENDVSLGIGIPAAIMLCVGLAKLGAEKKMFSSVSDAVEHFKEGLDALSFDAMNGGNNVGKH
jgi:hypothetical protein